MDVYNCNVYIKKNCDEKSRVKVLTTERCAYAESTSVMNHLKTNSEGSSVGGYTEMDTVIPL